MSIAETIKSLMSRPLFMGATVAAALVFMLVGVIFWGGFNTAMEATNTLKFCISCHEMEENVYQEYKQTVHYSNGSGVRATCSDCHVPDPWVYKIVRKIKASNEVLHWALGTIDTPEKFDAKRLTLAKNVWGEMKSTDSRECRNCHDFTTMQPENQKPRARKQHLNAMQAGNTCIDCHKGIAHKSVHDQLTDEEMDLLTQPDPDLAIGIPPHWQAFLDKEAEEKAEKKRQAAEEARKAAELAAEEAKKAAEVAAQLAKSQEQKPSAEAAKAPSGSAPKAAKSAINWAAIPARDMRVFYPGQSSMEWVLGRKHGGKRSFTKGDRCVDCHEEETMDIGDKIVTGEKLEDQIIPGKRGSIAVAVKAANDGKNLYLQFSWEDTEHQPAPFADGGKMDPENSMKLAFMLATDEVEYADRAGCWGTCHADLNGMPFAPEGQDVTKYIKESRTKIELKGRNKKPLGGWDKRKPDEEINAEFLSQHFMDIVRYNSGSQQVEDGNILADRLMNEGVISQATATKQGNLWVVEFKRPLETDEAGNITLSLDQVYNFGFAIHDDYSDGRFHHVSLGYKLGFDNSDVEINAVTQ
ncbi:NapC/NirT family cytochrome c [Aestuariirhabdus sp. Z084]|uniref:NapC/NirT family cytochrome c n=1 Tax=Aestuariirhabdus haliotis TaxID=2918751 RepID=UPI00201B412B|nr:NapC/NirT family cytochrome c [Aestuariirhabdus haliotis]MCL6416954.1 NapC/NirT family cytochrome c [Aestuariirhabdus haliotis]MCL6420943.1 NapC/NirT family cytochrome c [Aestuariirhabdus haliotis]